MAAIEKIRRRSGLLIAIIGIALLAFVLQDLFQSQGRNTGPTVAVVDGDKISVRDYEALKEKNLENRRSSNNNLSSAETYSIYNNTLEEMIKDNIMTKEYEAAGIGVTSEELMDQMTGDNPHPWVVQSFGDGNGNVDKQRVTEYLQNLNNLPAEYYNRWLDFEKAVKQNRLETKFDNLVKASYFLPTPLAKKYYENKNLKASADVIALRYTTIPDSTVTVTDADNKAFYEENKARYETDERRDIEYVLFEIKPSLEDRQDALKFVQDRKPEFEAAEDAAAYVNDSYNSDQRYDSTWLGRKDVPEMIEQAIFDNGNGVGYVYGPYENDDAFNLVRIVEMQNRPDSLRASHILIGYKGAYGSQDTITTKEQAEAKANELLAQLKAAKNNDELFSQLASEYNTDATKDKGGDLDWFTDGTMVPAFNEYVINSPVGSLGVVETMFGYHIVKVTDKTQPQPKARLAYLTHKITWSTKTYQNVYAEANKFFAENRTYDQFNKAIEEQGLTKRTMPAMEKSTYQITGLENPREIVRWAFDKNTKKGDISDKIFELDNNQLVVAALTGIIPEGYAPMDVVIDRSKYQILNKKKGEMAVDKLKACGNDVNRMVNELGAESTTVSDLNIDSRVLSNFGVEADIVGKILGMKEGEEVGPVAGNASAFIIKNVKFTQPEETNDYSSIIREKTSQFTNRVLNNGVYNSLRKEVKIKDNRTEIF
jgi:peptidyl-prolyl cis-trans isomerase D